MRIACKAIAIAICVMALLPAATPSLALFGPFSGNGFGMGFPGIGFPGMGGFGLPGGFGSPAGYPGYYGYPGYDAFGAGNNGLNLCINMPGIGSISFGGFNSGIGAVSC